MHMIEQLSFIEARLFALNLSIKSKITFLIISLMPTLIDLSHTIFDGLITYKGLPAPIICDYLSRENSKQFYKDGTEFQIGKIEMVTNTGTYIDCPFHRFEHGKDLSQIALEQCAGLDAITINAKDATAIGTAYFEGKEKKTKQYWFIPDGPGIGTRLIILRAIRTLRKMRQCI